MKNIITLFILLCSIPLISQESAYWQKLDKDALLLKSPKWSDPATALVFRLNINELEEICKDAGKPDSKLVLIPNPDGKIDSFLIRENELMPEELKQKFPEIRSYSGYRLGMPGTQVHLDLVPQGFHAMVQTEKETYFIDPVYRGNRDIYYCYNKSEYGKASDTNWTCTLGAATDDIRRDSKKLKN